jgi:hypothetical protein
MTTIIMLFLFPIGFYTYFFIERKTKKEYQKVFDDFQVNTVSKSKLTNKEKINLFEQMLLQNEYEVIEVSESRVMGEKKVLSLAFIFMGLGLYIVGLFFYLAYFFWLQKPHRVEFSL